jgi:hypothetical protein
MVALQDAWLLARPHFFCQAEQFRHVANVDRS